MYIHLCGYVFVSLFCHKSYSNSVFSLLTNRKIPLHSGRTIPFQVLITVNGEWVFAQPIHFLGLYLQPLYIFTSFGGTKDGAIERTK